MGYPCIDVTTRAPGEGPAEEGCDRAGAVYRGGGVFDQGRGRYAAFTHDLVMVPVVWLGALWLRFNLGDIPNVYLYHALLDLASFEPYFDARRSAKKWAQPAKRGIAPYRSSMIYRELPNSETNLELESAMVS